MRQDRPTRHPALLHPRSPLWVRQAHCPPKLGIGPCSLRPGRSRQRSENRPTASRFGADRERRQCEQSRFPRNDECLPFSPHCSGALPFRFYVQKTMAGTHNRKWLAPASSRAASLRTASRITLLGPEFGERNRPRQVSPQPGQGMSKDQPLAFAASGASGLAVANGPFLGADLFLSLLKADELDRIGAVVA